MDEDKLMKGLAFVWHRESGGVAYRMKHEVMTPHDTRTYEAWVARSDEHAGWVWRLALNGSVIASGESTSHLPAMEYADVAVGTAESIRIEQFVFPFADRPLP